jgi:hypothetical protein
MIVTDKQGNKYYDIEEGMRVLGVSRSTFLKMVSAAKLGKYRRERDRKVYYRVEDVEALKDRPAEMWLITEGDKNEQGGAAA